MNMIATLKINYLERSGNGLYLRFGTVDFEDKESFNDMRYALKNRKTTRWVPTACNGKGAWFIYPDVLEVYADRFVNYQEHMARLNKSERDYTSNDWDNHFRQQYGGRSTPPRYNPSGDHLVVMKSFDMLGLTLSSTPQQVKTVFHQLAFKYHPDHGGDTVTMMRLNAAYEVAYKYAESHNRISA